MQFQVKLDPPDAKGLIVVHFPDFEWGITQGETEEEALEMAEDVVEIYLDDCIKSGKPIPRTRKRSGGNYRTVRVPALIAAKAELHQALLDSGMKRADLAKHLGIPQINIERLFNLKNRSHFDLIENAFRAVGQEMEIAVHPGAPMPSFAGRVEQRAKRRGPRLVRRERTPA